MARNFDFLIDRTSLREQFEDFIAAKVAGGISQGTVKAYRNHFGAISKWLDPDMEVDQITDRTIQKAISGMAATDLSRNSIRSYTATLASFFSWLREEGLTRVKVPLFRGEESIPDTYTDEELQALLRPPAARCRFGEYRTWVIVNLLVNNGIRAASVRMIQNRDVDLENSIILLRHTKRRKAQAVPLSPSLVKILRDYTRIRKGAPEDPLFPDVNGNVMSHNCLRNAIKRFNSTRGVQAAGIHMFRHTFARIYLIECGGDALKLQRLLGHSTLDMTKKYVKIYDDDLVREFQTRSPLDEIKKKKDGQGSPLP